MTRKVLLWLTIVMLMTIGIRAWKDIYFVGELEQNGNYKPCQQETCSQEIRFSDDTPFSCSIHGLADCHRMRFYDTICGNRSSWELEEGRRDWNTYQLGNDIPECINSSKDNHPFIPFLTHIALYDSQSYAATGYHEPNPTLNMSITAPFTNTTASRAILMHFQSIDVPYYSDPFYRDHQRYRLFRYDLWKPSTYDFTNPRYVSYPCFFGLDDYIYECHFHRIYKVTLTSFTLTKPEGASIVYHITSHNCRFNVNQTFQWKPTIAVAVIPNTADVHVVLESHPNIVLQYKVTLVKLNENVKTIISTRLINSTSERLECSFANNLEGEYQVQVTFIGNHSYSHNFYIHQGNQPCKAVLDLSKHHESGLHIIFSISGIVVALFLLLTICLYKVKYSFKMVCTSDETGDLVSSNNASDLSNNNTSMSVQRESFKNEENRVLIRNNNATTISNNASVPVKRNSFTNENNRVGNSNPPTISDNATVQVQRNSLTTNPVDITDIHIRNHDHSCPVHGTQQDSMLVRNNHQSSQLQSPDIRYSEDEYAISMNERENRNQNNLNEIDEIHQEFLQLNDISIDTDNSNLQYPY